MELTEAQAAHFDAFGFLKLRAFSDGEVRAMVAEAEAAEPACSDPVERSELLTALMVRLWVPYQPADHQASPKREMSWGALIRFRRGRGGPGATAARSGSGPTK